jgi:hypothetical protein
LQILQLTTLKLLEIGVYMIPKKQQKQPKESGLTKLGLDLQRELVFCGAKMPFNDFCKERRRDSSFQEDLENDTIAYLLSQFKGEYSMEDVSYLNQHYSQDLLYTAKNFAQSVYNKTNPHLMVTVDDSVLSLYKENGIIYIDTTLKLFVSNPYDRNPSKTSVGTLRCLGQLVDTVPRSELSANSKLKVISIEHFYPRTYLPVISPAIRELTESLHREAENFSVSPATSHQRVHR